MLKSVKAAAAAFLLLFNSLAATAAETSLDSERLDLEMRMQQRVEDALGKILPPGQFVVVIRVEPVVPEPVTKAAAEKKGDSDNYYLPGVPERRLLSDRGGSMKDLVESLKPESKIFQRFVNRVTVTLVVDKDVANDVVDRIRVLTRQMLGLDDARGDTLDIQRTAFNKPVNDALSLSGIQRMQRDLRSYWLIILLALTLFCIAIFILFVFGPLRAFLNKFVQVLPTLRPAEAPRNARQVFDVPQFAYPPPQAALPAAAGSPNFSGSLQVENPNKTIAPFGFIREDHLPNLAVLLARETPEKAAVVLGYLPPEWISRVLERLDPSLQTEVASSLATTRQLLPEQVEDIEQDLKRRLDYLIGGPERIYAVYESLEPEAQRRMLDSLRESRPELAEELRQRTMMFEDLQRLDAAALKSLMREVELQTLVMALRGVSAAFRDRVLEHMSQGKAQIIREELELSEGSGGRATQDAQRKVVQIAKRLEREGQITIPAGNGATVRFGLPGTAEGGDKVGQSGEDGIDTMRERFRQMIGRSDSTGTGG